MTAPLAVHGAVLGCVRERPGITSRQVVEALPQYRWNRVTRTIRDLISEGMVARAPDGGLHMRVMREWNLVAQVLKGMEDGV